MSGIDFTVYPDLPETKDKNGVELEIGTRVRSYDFPFNKDTMTEGENACWMEGVIEGVCKGFPDCNRYAIRVKYQVFGGKEKTDLVDDLIFPPLNGLEGSLTGGLTAGVVAVESQEG